MPIFDTTVESRIASLEAEVKGLRTRDQRNMAHLMKVLTDQTVKLNAIYEHLMPPVTTQNAKPESTKLQDASTKHEPASKPKSKSKW